MIHKLKSSKIILVGSFHNLLVPRGLVDEAGAVVVVVAEVDQVFANDIKRLIQMNLK